MNKFEEIYNKIISEAAEETEFNENDGFKESSTSFYAISKELNGKRVFLIHYDFGYGWKFVSSLTSIGTYNKYQIKENAEKQLKQFQKELEENPKDSKYFHFDGDRKDVENGLKIVKVTIKKIIKKDIDIEEE